MQLSLLIVWAGLICCSSAALTGSWRRSPAANDTTAALILGETVSGTCFTVSDLAAFKTCDNDLTWEDAPFEKRVNQLGHKAMKTMKSMKKEVKAKKPKKCSRRQSLSFDIPVNQTTSIPFFGSTTDVPYSLVSFDLTGPFTFAELTTLIVNYEFLIGNCGGGSLRWAIFGEGLPGAAFLYFGDIVTYTDCTTGVNDHSGVNLMTLTDLRWDLAQIGGAFYNNITDAARLMGNANITNIQLVVDSAWLLNQSLALGNVQINDQTLFTPSIGSCPFNSNLPFNVTRLTTQPNCTKQAYPNAVKPDQGNTFELQLNAEWNPYYNPNQDVEEEEETTHKGKGKGKGKTTTVQDLWYPCFLNYDFPLANITSYGNYALNIFSADGLTVLETIEFSVVKPVKPTKKAKKNNMKNMKNKKGKKQY